jgi:hypothetical protein
VATTARLRATTGCHDITVYQAIDLAAGACTGQGAIIDISEPINPEVISSVEDENFAFWHSATISQDGKRVLFTDEKGGGGGAECNVTAGPERGADAIYDISDPTKPQFMSYYKMSRPQTNHENCVAHNGNALPIKGRDILVQSWYQGGISVVDWTDGFHPEELAYFDRGPIDPNRLVLGGFWSSYYYTAASSGARSSAASTCSSCWVATSARPSASGRARSTPRRSSRCAAATATDRTLTEPPALSGPGAHRRWRRC